MRQEAFESGYGWLCSAVPVVCVQSNKKDSSQRPPGCQVGAALSGAPLVVEVPGLLCRAYHLESGVAYRMKPSCYAFRFGNEFPSVT